MTNAMADTSLRGGTPEQDTSPRLDCKKAESSPVSDRHEPSSPSPSPIASNCLASQPQYGLADIADVREQSGNTPFAKSADNHENGDEPFRSYMGGSAEAVCVLPLDSLPPPGQVDEFRRID